jgi:peptide/nickel transport system permease protein
MLGFIARRLGLSVFVALGVVLLTFVIARVVPGDPAGAWAGPRASPAERERVRERFGLDDPLIEQFAFYVLGVLRGDWGVSLRTRHPVLDDLAGVLPHSLQLVGAALLLSLVLGVPAGLLAAAFHNRLPDVVVRLGGLLGAAMPPFWAALLLQMLFAGRLGWLPVAGVYDRATSQAHPLTSVTGMPALDALLTGNGPMLASSLTHLLLPAVVVAGLPFALISRMVRAAALEALGEPYIEMARALGFSRRQVLLRFVLRSAWGPVLQVSALIFGLSLVGTFLVEAVFNYPGLGDYLSEAVPALDVPAIVGVTLLVGLCYIAANLAADCLQAALDPRITAGRSACA